MAEPVNTPMPPGTPIPASTPRSTSPAPHQQAAAATDSSISPANPSLVVPLPTSLHSLPQAVALASSPAQPASDLNGGKGRPRVLHIGDAIRYNPETYAALTTRCDVIRPEAAERERGAFIQALREKKWGDFDAIMRPFWGSGGEMGRWDDELISLLPESVKVFASAGSGFDWANVRVLGEHGIVYCNSGIAAAEAVADFTVAMIISTFRHLPWCMGAAVSGDAGRFRDCHTNATFTSHTLRGRAVGFIGLGNIGQAVATRCGHGFGMPVHYYDVVRKSAEVESQLKATFHQTLEALIREVDCVVLCAPADNGQAQAEGTKSRPMMTAEELAWFRPGTRFVNVARGSMLDEEALADALEEGRISAAAIDVHHDEPDINPRLRAMSDSRVMVTCHNAGGTVETHVGFEELSMRNVMAVLAGGEPITPVNLEFLKR